MTTTVIPINTPAYSRGAMYAAVHITQLGAFYAAGSSFPFLSYVTPAGAYTQILASNASKLAIFSSTLWASVGNRVGFVGIAYTLPTSASNFTVILNHTEAIKSFQWQTDFVLWVCSASGIMAYDNTLPPMRSITSWLPNTDGCSE